jgi:hypothetical protein
VNFSDYASLLQTESVVCIPFLTKTQLTQWRALFHQSVAQFPEYKNASKAEHLVQGGFAALGNASSFHCPFSRFARLEMQKFALPFFQALKKERQEINGQEINGKESNDLKMEQLIDRLMSRSSSKKPTAESWHRDQCGKPGDVTFGGWVNLDLTPQYFSCVKGTHSDKAGLSGFKPVKDEKQKALYEAQKSLIVVDPGMSVCVALFVFFSL